MEVNASAPLQHVHVSTAPNENGGKVVESMKSQPVHVCAVCMCMRRIEREEGWGDGLKQE